MMLVARHKVQKHFSGGGVNHRSGLGGGGWRLTYNRQAQKKNAQNQQ